MYIKLKLRTTYLLEDGDISDLKNIDQDEVVNCTLHQIFTNMHNGVKIG
ncbi:MAG: hypothetical protein WCQ54_03380 [Clostridiaceae bacterium]